MMIVVYLLKEMLVKQLIRIAYSKKINNLE